MSAGLIAWLGFIAWLMVMPIALTWAKSLDEAQENHILTEDGIIKLDEPRKMVARKYLQHANRPLTQGQLTEIYQQNLDTVRTKELLEKQRKSLQI